MSSKIEKVLVKNIRVIGEHRPLDKEKLQAISDSMAKIGLRTPITVRIRKNGPVLVVGQHRLEAAKLLRWKRIECFVIDTNKIDALLWNVAENFHRANLTALQQADSIKQWERLLKKQNKGAQVAQPGGRQPHDKGVSQTAKALRITREEVQRSRKIAAISPEARSAAKKAGLGDNKAALLAVADAATPKAQIKKVNEIVRRKLAQRHHQLSRTDGRKLKRLKRTFKAAREFKQAWRDAAAIVRQKFIKTVLQPGGGQ